MALEIQPTTDRRVGLKSDLGDAESRELLAAAIDNFPLEVCDTCECFLGFVAQIEMDADESARDYLSGFHRDPDQMHSCLGCDPCPPADEFASYIRQSGCGECSTTE